MKPWILALLASSLALACRTGPTSDEPPRAYGDVRSEHVVASSALASNAKVESAAPEAAVPHAHAKPKNRDPKGQPDVDRYIQRLESEDRRKELKVDLVIARLGLARDAVVGDLGCGPGVFTIPLARACSEGVVFASDVEPAQIDRVRELAEERGLRNVVPVLAGAHDPHLPPRALDLVFLADTYHHLEDRVAYFERLKEVLRPGGRLAIVEYKPGTLPVGPPADHKLPEGVMNRELERAGWVLIDRFNTHAYHDFEIWRPRREHESRD